MNRKLIAIPALALAAGIGLAACGTTSTVTPPLVARTVPATTAPATTTPAAESPVGIWNISYASSPTAIFGQYAITKSGETYTLTVKSPVSPPYINCTLPVGTEEGTFTAIGPTTFSGSGKEWYATSGTCTYGAMSPITLQFVNSNEINLQYASGGGPLSFILSKPGTTPVTTAPIPVPTTTQAPAPTTAAPAPSATAPSASPSSSTDGCIVPNVIGKWAIDSGGNPTVNDSAAIVKVENITACGPGYFVKEVSETGGSIRGAIWKEVPAPGTHEPAGTTVTLYISPG